MTGMDTVVRLMGAFAASTGLSAHGATQRRYLWTDAAAFRPVRSRLRCQSR